MILNETHDPARRSWVETAGGDGTDFPIQNLPLGVFHRVGETPADARLGVAIGDSVLDLRAAADLLAGPDLPATLCTADRLNPLMAAGPRASAVLRSRVSAALSAQAPAALRERLAPCLLPQAAAVLQLPARIGGFTDFFTSRFHAERAGQVSRPERPLPPAFVHMPMGYNGRASSVVASPQPITRPHGLSVDAETGVYRFGPTTALDFELEVGVFAGPGNRLGEPLSMAAAPGHLFGYCLINDWSARDIQRAESFPLGPFMGKSVMTSVSPWVVTAEALAPFRIAATAAREHAPAHLLDAHDLEAGGLDVALTAALLTPRMRERGEAPHVLTRSHLRHGHWSFAQMLVHHASNGCAVQPGDLLSSGTVSGPGIESAACLFEACYDPVARRHRPIPLHNGEQRTWLEDGDELVLQARATREGFVPIGFGECRGRVLPAVDFPH